MQNGLLKVLSTTKPCSYYPLGHPSSCTLEDWFVEVAFYVLSPAASLAGNFHVSWLCGFNDGLLELLASACESEGLSCPPAEILLAHRDDKDLRGWPGSVRCGEFASADKFPSRPVPPGAKDEASLVHDFSGKREESIDKIKQPHTCTYCWAMKMQAEVTKTEAASNSEMDRHGVSEKPAPLKEGFAYLPASSINLPFLAAALLQSAVATALSKTAADFLRMATEALPAIELPLDLRTGPPNKKPRLAGGGDEVTKEEVGEPLEPLALIKKPKLANGTNGALDLTHWPAEPNRRGPEFFSNLPSSLQFTYTLGYGNQLFPRISPTTPPSEDEGPLDFSAPSEHPCTYPGCNKVFRYNHALINHYRIHTGEKPYICDHPGCQQAFARQSNLLTHRMVHLDRGMRKTFACTVPGCQKNFLKKTNLDDHMNLHLNKRPYACDFPDCGKSFRCRSNLSGHKRVHAREAAKDLANRPSPLERKIDTILARARASVASHSVILE
ncbi:unnamed protein product [Mesocestoides corti]|uniref:C2H2-type domain-containing protein n=1 Tax=Mesocestoides corti TaxID=53468 RepID=A0A158QT24_MESCO|nr:unnamed protein product [Mesocestoides corti]